MAFTEGYQAGESTAALLDLMGLDLRRELVGDNKAALAQVVGDTGPWRTRHLRIRAAKVREAIRSDMVPWTAKHLEGSLLVADGCTKGLQGGAFRSFVERLGMTDFKEKNVGEVAGVRRMEAEPHGERDLLHDGSVALLGGGLALLCGSQRRHLGLLLMACGGLLQGWEYQDRKKKDNDRIRDPTKDREEGSKNDDESGSGTAKTMGTGVTGTPPLGLERLWECRKTRMDKTQQDPQRTTGDLSGKGTTHPQGTSPLGKGTRSESSQHDQKEGQVMVGGRSPGIRAFRMTGKGGKPEPQVPNRGKGATARGVDAMAQLDRVGTTAGDNMAASSAAAAGGDDTTWRSSSTTRAGYAGEVHVTVQVRPFGMDEKKGGDGDGGADHQQTPVDPRIPAAPVEVKDFKWTRAEEGQPEAMKTPWELERFQRPIVGSSDQWDSSLLYGGWLVRVHRKPRKRLFHPVHGTLPVPEERLDCVRGTVRFFKSGGKEVRVDDWRGKTRTEDGLQWTGYTFIKVAIKEKNDGGVASSATSSMASAAMTAMVAPAAVAASMMERVDEVSDGSYEFIGEGLESRP